MGLQPCPECDRHVRRAATACPFCAAKLPTTRSARSFGVAVAGAAVLSTALTACPRAAAKYGGPPLPEPQPEQVEQPVEAPPQEPGPDDPVTNTEAEADEVAAPEPE